MIIWQQETKTSAVLAFEARKLNLFVEVCTDSNWIQCWMHWRCTKHWLRPNRSCHLKKACHKIFFEWTVPFKTVKIHLHSKRSSLTIPEWILSRLRWAHSQVVRTWTNSPSWLPLVASEFPVFPNEKSGPAVQRLSLSPALSEVVNSNDKFANSFWKKVRTMICWHDGHLLLTGEVCRMFTTLKRAGELETFVGLKYRPPWMGPESKMVFSCNMRVLVQPLQERFRQNPNPSVYCTPPQSPCWEMRKHRQDMTESLHLPPNKNCN